MRADASFLVRSHGKVLIDDLFNGDALARATGWLPFRAGIEILPLYGEPGQTNSKGPSAALLRYQPGATVPPHDHTGHEHVVVLSGSQRDASGTYERGAFVISEPGSRHSVTSDNGCVVLVFWNQAIAFVDPNDA